MRLRAMAKINLGLDILGKRDDGYHEVRMLMQTIQMYDLLDIRRKSSPGITLTTNLLYVPSDERNLVYKAAKLLMDEFDIQELELAGSTEEEVYLYFYDCYVGGLGFAEKIYDLIPKVVEQAVRMVSGCPADPAF